MSRVQSAAFMHIFEILPKLSEAKIKEGVFTGPDIRELLKNEEFERLMKKKKKLHGKFLEKCPKNF